MKITVRLPDVLVDRARSFAARERTTLQELVESGLRREIEARNRTKPFKLRDGSFKGNGLHPDVAGMSWEQIRALSYAIDES